MEHVKGLDHLVFLARDLDDCAECFRRLGFNLSPRGEHDLLQTSNHTIIFEHDYLEIMAVRSPCAENEVFHKLVQRREGLGYLVLSTDDANELSTELNEAGVEATGPTDFSRDVVRPEGKYEASFRIVRVPPEETAGARFFYCQHKTPELVWLPELSSHENGVTGISSVTLVVESVSDQVQALGRTVGELPTTETEGRVLLRLGNSVLEIQTAGSFAEQHGLPPEIVAAQAPYYGVATLNVSDITKTKAVLMGNKVAFEHDGASISVDQISELGVNLTFVQDSAE